jgi:hypothetical protein
VMEDIMSIEEVKASEEALSKLNSRKGIHT